MDGDITYKISDHVPIGLSFNDNYGETWSETYESYFFVGSIKDNVKYLLEIEGKHSVKFNKTMIINKDDILYHEANNGCHICSKTCVNKLEITVMKQANIEVLHVIFVI